MQNYATACKLVNCALRCSLVPKKGVFRLLTCKIPVYTVAVCLMICRERLTLLARVSQIMGRDPNVGRQDFIHG